MIVSEAFYLAVVYISIAIGLWFTNWLAKWLLSRDEGDQAMRQVSSYIREGADAFLKTQYTMVAIFSLGFAVLIFFVYVLLRSGGEVDDFPVPNTVLGLITALSFLLGALCSGFSGWFGMWVSVRTNVRGAAAARQSADEAIKVCLRGGAFSGMLIVSLSLFGVTLLYTLARIFIPGVTIMQAPDLIVGYGFGASFVALFAQLGGGIYTKAADVGADIVGKIDMNIPEDDPRNPAVVADLVGDNVGDCAGRGADLFESTAAENIGAMILGTSVVMHCTNVECPVSFVLFPLFCRALGLLASILGVLAVKANPSQRAKQEAAHKKDHFRQSQSNVQYEQQLLQLQEQEQSQQAKKKKKKQAHKKGAETVNSSDSNILSQEGPSTANAPAPAPAPNSPDGLAADAQDTEGQYDLDQDTDEDPINSLNRGYFTTLAIAAVLIVVAARLSLNATDNGYCWFNFALCGLIGVVLSFVFVFITEYYTDCDHRPVQSIAAASEQGHGTNVIAGIAVGLESTGIPTLCIVTALLTSYWLGASSGLSNQKVAGIYGTACATMGMLASVGFVLAMDTFGPISDNAGGIAEMAHCHESVRRRVDRLDAVGNTTKALTKGYAVGSAALASFLLFSAFLDSVADYTGDETIKIVSFSVPEVFVGGFLGLCLVFFFSALAIKAVGKTAQLVVVEVKRQFKEKPGIIAGTERPEYGRCVEIVTRGALKEMVLPCVVVLAVPVTVGLVFRVLGVSVDIPNLGAQALAALLMCATIGGVLLGLFLNNAGGAWDNAKKYIETGECGGKGSDAHKAAVTGDTVGDPCKDTAGPSLHVLVKLLSTITLVLYPIFAAPRARVFLTGDEAAAGTAQSAVVGTNLFPTA